MIRSTALIALATFGIAGCATIGSIPTARIATATLRSANGLPAGTAILTASGDHVSLNLAAIGLPVGGHGVHLHIVGKCETPAFASAGGHLNPAGHLHGTANPAGSHLGDLPNLMIESRGVGGISVQLPGTRAELEAALFDGDGSAIVVHASPDDYKTDPSGNSGVRIACGVLERS